MEGEEEEGEGSGSVSKANEKRAKVLETRRLEAQERGRTMGIKGGVAEFDESELEWVVAGEGSCALLWCCCCDELWRTTALLELAEAS